MAPISSSASGAAGTGVASSSTTGGPAGVAGGGRLELHGHEGYVSSIRFNGPNTVLTASGDSTCKLWDLERVAPIRHFTDHGSDVLCLTVSPASPHIFSTGSVDTTARVWDARMPRCVQVFSGHEGDVNAIACMPNGHTIGTAGDDATCRLWDTRAYSRTNNFASDGIATEATAICFSASGRILFAGHDDCNVYAWDTLKEDAAAPVYTLSAHRYRVSAVAVNGSGEALGTGSWDAETGIWA